MNQRWIVIVLILALGLIACTQNTESKQTTELSPNLLTLLGTTLTSDNLVQ